MFQRVGLVLLFICAFVCVARPGASEDATETKVTRQDRLNQLHLDQAKDHVFHRSRERKELLDVREKPVYVWTNPTRNSVQEGAVFVWTHRGRPEIIGTVFSHPDGARPDMRQVNHEFHSLSRYVFHHEHPSQQWEPRAGIVTKPIPGAPNVDSAKTKRFLRMRSMARDFTAQSDGSAEAYQLRMLPRPVLRYQPEAEEVLDGSLFVFATNAGTDPEVVLMIEAVKHKDAYRWEYAVCRFSDQNLFVKHKRDEVWKSVRSATNAFLHDEQHLYRLMFVAQVPGKRIKSED